MSNFIDLSGKLFNNLTVINVSDRRDKRGGCYWNCKCVCGNSKVVKSQHLRRGIVKSCGCLHYQKGPNSNRWQGYGEITGHKFSQIKQGAKLRQIEFNVSQEYIWELFLSQNRKCALTNLNIDFTENKTASLDRIDSKKGYIVGNLQWVHKQINVMKSAFTQESFIVMCQDIARNVGRVDEEKLQVKLDLQYKMNKLYDLEYRE